MPYLEKFNRDDIHARAIIVGLINLLNQEIFFVNTISNTEQKIVEVPFYYSNTGDERFLQDYFLEWRDCVHPKFLDGNFDPIPRGVVNIEGMDINTGNLTQRWIRGNFTRLINGQLETFSAYLNSIPLDMNFNVKIQTDTMTDAFKIIQALIEVFYKVQIFNVSFKGVMVPCQVGFPENYNIEKMFEFVYPADTKIEISFSLALETYYPVFDEPNLGSRNAIANANAMQDWVNNTSGNTAIDMPATTSTSSDDRLGTPMNDGTSYFVGESRRDRISVQSGTSDTSISDNLSGYGRSVRSVANRMEAIITDSFKLDSNDNPPTIEITNPLVNETYYVGDEINLKWSYTNYIHKVDIYYSIDYGQSWVLIERLYNASLGEYKWIVPNLTGLLDVLVIKTNKKGDGAIIQALVDINGSIYDTVIINPGNNYDQTVSLEIESDTGSGVELVPSVIDGKIVDVLIRQPGVNYVVSKQAEVSFKIISSTGSADDFLKDDQGNIGVVLVK